MKRRLAGAVALSLLFGTACKMPLLTKEMMAVAKDTSGLVMVAGNARVVAEWVADPMATYTLYYTTNGTTALPENGSSMSDVKPGTAIDDLVNGNLHSFLLVARYANGNEKRLGPVNVIPLSARSLTPVVSNDGMDLALEWPSIAGATSFRLYRSLQPTGQYSLIGEVFGTKYLDSGLLPDTTYYYQVEPSDVIGARSEAGAGRVAGRGTTDQVIDERAVNNHTKTVPDASGAYAYSLGDSAEVQILDLGAKGMPTIGSFTLPSGQGARDAVVDGDRLCVISYRSAYVYDIGDPRNPILSASYLDGSYQKAFEAVSIKANYIYLLGRPGLEIMEISGTSIVPRKVIGGPWSQVEWLVVAGNYAYVCPYTGSSGSVLIERFDISDPANPVVKTSFTLPGYLSSSCGLGLGNYLYFVAQGAPGTRVHVLDCSSAATMSLWKSFPVSVGVQDIKILGSSLVTVEFNSAFKSLHTYSIANLDAVVPVSSTLLGDYPYGFELNGTIALVRYGQGLAKVGTGLPQAQVRYASPGIGSGGIAVSGSDAFSSVFVGAPAYSILKTHDLSSSSFSAWSEKSGEQLSLGFLGQCMAVSGVAGSAGRCLYVSGDNQSLSDLHIVDLEKRTVKRWGTTGRISAIRFYGAYAYIAQGESGVEILDASDPLNPRSINRLPSKGSATDIDISGGYAYVSMGAGGVCVYSLRDPSRPQFIQSLGGMSAARCLKVYGSYLYVTDGGSLRVVNISDPKAPYLKDSIPVGGAYVSTMAIAGNKAILGIQANNMQPLIASFVDLMLPDKPVVVGQLQTRGGNGGNLPEMRSYGSHVLAPQLMAGSQEQAFMAIELR
ncbi:MAG: hypothetical protein JNG85_06015 [Spirochaetaceae bacterium]|nr:hypothetical protein [Spirochaetaceae bacterium]